MRGLPSWTLVCLGLVLGSVDAQGAAYAGRSQSCCSALTRALGPQKVFYPTNDQYKSSVASYWALQAQLSPDCVVIPTSSKDVSTAVKTLTRGNRAERCPFAVRGGGHTPWAGAANIENGVTISLRGLNGVTLSDDRSVASVGGGATWDEVYKVLDPLEVAIPGGRIAGVGVGGLTLGGGNSYFTARTGLVCDSVTNFEVVLGSGETVNANSQERPDLFQVLKGGSNNFGIVTRFDFAAFEQGKLWGGLVVYPAETLTEQVTAISRFTDAIPEDPYASLISIYAYNSTLGQSYFANAYEYTKPEVNPAPFREFTAIQPELTNTMRITTLTDLVAETVGPYSLRTLFATITVGNKPEILARALEISDAGLEPFRGSELAWNVLLQPLPRLFADLGVERGGNILGLDREQGNSVLLLFSVTWLEPSDEARINAAVRSVMDEITEYAKSVGAARDFEYLNYALPSQDPLGSYGPENVEKMRVASKKYDPDQVFQKQVPGGFKLDRAGPA